LKDLNLLKVFEAIMSTGSVGEAAKKLYVSAPAISQSLAKLRSEYNDPLFIRDGRGLKPSSFALSLYDELEEPLSIIMNSSEINSVFYPLTSKRTFRIASNPDIDSLFFTKLKRKILKNAPNVNIEMQAEERNEEKIQNLLRLRKVDLIITTLPLNERSYVNESITKLEACIVCRTDHPRIKDSITVDEFFKEEHCSWASPVDKTSLFDSASDFGISDRRNIVYSSKSLFNLSLMARDSDLLSICTVPHFNMIKNVGGIKSLKLPFDVNDSDVFFCWHKSFNKDKGLAWLRALLKDCIK